jgi:putative tryptophan/tyrosine transport system substrate-binding protein
LILVSLVVLVVRPVTAQSQTRVWHIGLFHVGLDHEPPSLPTLRNTLKDLGYEEGKNLQFDWRNQVDENAARTTASQFVRERVDLIVAFEDQTVRAAKAATSQIPIVFLHVHDPVADGYVQSLSHPGGNLTGLVSFQEVGAKRLQLFKQIIPELQHVLILVDPEDPITPQELAETRRAAGVLGLELVERQISRPDQAERVFDALRPGEVDGVFVVSPSLLTKFFRTFVRLANRARPPFGGASEGVGGGRRTVLLQFRPSLAKTGPIRRSRLLDGRPIGGLGAASVA